MEELSVLAVARPWHYWLAVGLLATGVVLVVAIAVGYYRKVLVPLYERRMAELQPSAPRQPLTAAPPRSHRRLGQSSTPRAA